MLQKGLQRRLQSFFRGLWLEQEWAWAMAIDLIVLKTVM